MNKQSGFTLIELIMVIVILGILAATALPKFVDLSSDAKVAAVRGVAGGLTSAGSINYAARSISGTAAANTYATSAVGVTCDDIAANILQGGKPAGYTFVDGTKANGVFPCTVKDAADTAVSAVANIPLIN